MMSFAQPGATQLPPLDAIKPGISFPLVKGQSFSVDDIKQATCLGSEGELPMKGPQGRKSTSVDLSGPDSLFACLDYSEDGTRLYVGKYVDYDRLELTSLREIDGW